MAIDKERHNKGERDFLYIVGAKLNESTMWFLCWKRNINTKHQPSIFQISKMATEA